MFWRRLRLILAMKVTNLSNNILIDTSKEAAMLVLGGGNFDVTKVNENAQIAADVVNEFLERLR